jgi:hypothetical protein
MARPAEQLLRRFPLGQTLILHHTRIGFKEGRLGMSFGIYAIGYLVLIAGVAYLAHLMHIPQHYIVAIAVIMLGVGIVTGVQTTRHKDPS